MKSDLSTIGNSIIENQNKINLLESQLKSYNDLRALNGAIETLKTYTKTKDFNLKRDFVNKYVNKIIVYKVDKTNIEFKNPLQLNEKIIYVEMYAYGSITPLKLVLTPYSKNVYTSNKLQFNKDDNFLYLSAQDTSR